MRPNDSRNPSWLIVEGPDDKHTLIHLAKTHGVDWESDGGWAPYIHAAGSFEAALRYAPTAVRVTRRLGLVVDADRSALAQWNRVCKAIGIPNPPVSPPSGGYVGLVGTCRFGVWIMPDNQRSGALEEFLVDLIPAEDSVWGFAQDVSLEAKRRGAPFEDRHASKAAVRTWLAWRKQPGVPLGMAISNGYFNPRPPVALSFVDWFQQMFRDDHD